VPLPPDFVQHIVETMNQQHFSFVEINPLIVQDEHCYLLDAAVLVDSAGMYESSWTTADIVTTETLSELEREIAQLNNNSPASFSFKLLHPNGSLWMQLMGGGACITIADEASNQNKTSFVAGYGEYSGGPTTEEIYLYTKSVLRQLLASSAPKKAFIIAGGAANFSDVKVMFKGVIQAMNEKLDELSSQQINVFIRRAGPNEIEGLALISEFLHEHGLYGSVHGSETVLTDVINEALEYVDA
jgi:succinyl-CoA synthetase beta subunit